MKSQNSEFNHLKIILLHILVNKNWEMKNLDISNNIKNRKKNLQFGNCQTLLREIKD